MTANKLNECPFICSYSLHHIHTFIMSQGTEAEGNDAKHIPLPSRMETQGGS
jgi:hypothetical protein